VRSSLAEWLPREATAAHAELGRLRVLDVGCGVKPYYPYFAPYADSYLGVDVVENPAAELLGGVEDLPVEDGSFDVVLFTQVLEHCDDPARAVAELRRTAFRSTTRRHRTTGVGRTRGSIGSSPRTASGRVSTSFRPVVPPLVSRCS